MPPSGRISRHVIIKTLGTWLRGDERGFRSRGPRIYSSGEHKHRPPAAEHEGLHDYHVERSRGEIHIDLSLRPIMGRAIAKYLMDNGHRVLVVAITKVHAHFLTELPGALSDVKRIVGHVKRGSSRV